ncbi:MAG TPA: efflux RND transporter periplasmic adaptor subunit, partial [Anaeromyxobacter sp.]
AARTGQDGPRRPRRAVWVLQGDGTPKQVQVQVGPSDGKNTAIVGGDLAEGDRVVTGVSGGGAQDTKGPQQQRGPPRFL